MKQDQERMKIASFFLCKCYITKKEKFKIQSRLFVGHITVISFSFTGLQIGKEIQNRDGNLYK